MPSSILVVGSSNTDMVVKTDALPGPGETVLGGQFFMNPGGKGANQAVAAARLKGKVAFLTKLGADIFGSQALEQFRKEGIDTQYVLVDPGLASGVALITVDAKGENTIAVAPGANGSLNANDVLAAKQAIRNADIILVQLEIPLAAVTALIGAAAEENKTVILNPAPACSLPDELLKKVDILTPNEKEAELLTGVKVVDAESAGEAARVLVGRGVRTVIVTLGKNGVLLAHGGVVKVIPAPVVSAVDTTAAGDVFNGALAVGLGEGKSIRDAVVFANYAAALSVTRLGAQSSAPTREETEAFIGAGG